MKKTFARIWLGVAATILLAGLCCNFASVILWFHAPEFIIGVGISIAVVAFIIITVIALEKVWG